MIDLGPLGAFSNAFGIRHGPAPFQLGNETWVSKVRLWFTMTVKAPLHAEWFDLMNDFHRVDPAMAFNTAHASIHMSSMIEVRVIRKIMNSNPLDGHARVVAFIQRLELGAVRMNLKMAVHAGLSGRDGCMGAVFNRVVAVATVDTKFTCMHGMAEGDRLCRHVSHIRRLWTETPGDHEDHIGWSRHSHEDDHRQKQVGPTWKYKVVTAHEPCPKKG